MIPQFQMSDEDRKTAQARSAEVRMARAKLRKALKSGDLSITDFFAQVDAGDTVAGRMRLHSFLRALPRVGKVTAETFIAESKIPSNHFMKGLGVRQRKAILDRFGA